jgi:glycosyltransferase involved in cell wall biosynthesis
MTGSSRLPTYVLVTPARNEGRYIEETIKAVIRQTVKPLRWHIVSDGSTDGTDEIVSNYCSQYSWIRLIRIPDRRERHFAGKVHAFNAGLRDFGILDYDCIGSLDADITFDEEYFEFLLTKLADMPALGVVGTPFVEDGRSYDYRYVSIEHVSGACQLFRRRCFEDIGGYVPSKAGGVDHVAVLTARMRGWQTRSFIEKQSVHRRTMGRAKFGPIRAKLEIGKLDYVLGAHPAWELFRSAYQMTKPPWVAGGMMILTGYAFSMLTRQPRSVSYELLKYRRNEQMRRLRQFLTRSIPLRRSPGTPSGD